MRLHPQKVPRRASGEAVSILPSLDGMRELGERRRVSTWVSSRVRTLVRDGPAPNSECCKSCEAGKGAR